MKIRIYLVPILFILGWWYLAFIDKEGHSPPIQTVDRPRYPLPESFKFLSAMDRKQLQEALAGDSELMAKLINEWEIDAYILENKGHHGIQHLKRCDFIRAQILKRQLNKGEPPFLTTTIKDDLGKTFHSGYKNLLPQTFTAASFLLALTDPENIIALPYGLREQVALYPETLTKKIKLSTDRHHAEALFQAKPEIAFVADYSHPALLESLSNQGVPLFCLKSINTLPDIVNAIQRIGVLIDKPLKAELLAIFMESALMAIDNRLIALNQEIAAQYGMPKVMVLNYYTHYSCPTVRTITGQLLDRLEKHNYLLFPSPSAKPNEWSIPVFQEQIIHFNPDCLILSACDTTGLKETIERNSAFSSLNAKRNNRIFFVDDTVQAPTQYVILAYYDLAQALMQ